MDPAPNRAGRSLLVVEDDPDNLQALASLLGDEGFHVLCARGGVEALAALEAGARPELILLDLGMTGMNGFEFLAARSCHPPAATIPVLVITGSDELRGRQAEIARDGVVGCMEKPVDPTELLEAIERHLDPDGGGAGPMAAGGSRVDPTTAPATPRDDLLAVVSHEIKTPLGTISMLASRLLTRAPPGSGERDDLETILRSTRRLAGLIRDLRDFSQIGSQKLEIETERHRLALLIGQAVENVRPLAETKEIGISERGLEAGVEVSCDRDRVLQVISNLLDNALKFTPAGGRISVSLSADEREARVEISDTGPGVSAEDLPRIFEPYVQAPAAQRASQSGSVGLGLYIARSLIERQGGALGATSQLGSGSTFWFTLPRAPAAPERPSAERRAHDRPLILVVDDDECFLREVAELLEEAGYRVASAGNCRDAWKQIASARSPALILLDIMLPDMDGWQLSAAMRSHPRLASIPTVIMTGLSREQIEPSLLGVQGLLEKPFRRAELLGVARRYAGRAPAGAPGGR